MSDLRIVDRLDDLARTMSRVADELESLNTQTAQRMGPDVVAALEAHRRARRRERL